MLCFLICHIFFASTSSCCISIILRRFSAHPVWRPHLLQGWATDFIPKLVSQARDDKLYDHLVHVGGFDAIATARQLAVNEGIFSGTSGGGILWAALQIAKAAKPGSNILAMITDTGERYLSTPCLTTFRPT
jgi:cysteine synthase